MPSEKELPRSRHVNDHRDANSSRASESPDADFTLGGFSEFGVGQGNRRWVPDPWSQGVPLLESIWPPVKYLKIHGPDHLRWLS